MSILGDTWQEAYGMSVWRTNIKRLLFWQKLFDASEMIEIFMDWWRQSGCTFISIMTFSILQLWKALPNVTVKAFHLFVFLHCLTFEVSSVGKQHSSQVNMNCVGKKDLLLYSHIVVISLQYLLRYRWCEWRNWWNWCSEHVYVIYVIHVMLC